MLQKLPQAGLHRQPIPRDGLICVRHTQCTQCIIVHLRAQAFQIHRTAVSHTHAAARRDHLVGQFQPQHLSSILPTPMADALRVEHQSVHIK